MSGEESVPNLVLEQLRAVRSDNEKTHRMLFDILQRLGSLEQKAGIMAPDIARWRPARQLRYVHQPY
jgi:hypothetical protein